MTTEKFNVTELARKAGINPRTALRHRAKLGIGILENIGNGVWKVTVEEWERIEKSCKGVKG